MKPYSADLRERVLAACAAGLDLVGEVAGQFGVSVSLIDKLRRRLRGPAARCHAGGIAGPVGRRRRTGRGPNHGLEGVAGAGFAAKKKGLHAAERDTGRVKGLRRAFLEALPGEDVTRFKFVDETSVQLAYTRRHGRAEGGRRVDQAVPLHNGPNVTVTAALTPQGLEAVMELDGAVNTASFVAYVRHVLGPTLAPGDVVVLDNLRVHKAPDVAEAVAAFGARRLFLPPYSPDFTPVELAFSKLKTGLRTAQTRTRDALREALRTAADWISEADAKNWFDHCRYHVH